LSHVSLPPTWNSPSTRQNHHAKPKKPQKARNKNLPDLGPAASSIFVFSQHQTEQSDLTTDTKIHYQTTLPKPLPTLEHPNLRARAYVDFSGRSD